MKNNEKIINNAYLQLIKNFILKIFNTPIYFSLSLLLLVLIVTFVFGHPYYQTNDDFMMRSIVDGSYGGFGKPNAFIIWQSIYYTQFMAKLYIKFPQIYWYDLFTYLFMSVSLIITTLCLYSKEGKNKNIFNLFLFIVIYFLYQLLFIRPQFSVTSGSLALAGFALYYYIFANKLSIFKNICLTLLMFLLFIQSSFVRYEVLFVMLPLGVIASILMLNKNVIKKYICMTLILSLAYTCSYCLQENYRNIIKNNPEYSHIVNSRKAYLDITEKSTIFQEKHVYLLFFSIINRIPDVDKKLQSIGWNRGTYLALLCGLEIGDENLFNIEKLKQVKEVFNSYLSIKNHFIFSFSVSDYYDYYKYYFLVILLLTLAIPSKKGVKKVLLLYIFYFLFILLANNRFKTFPPRVWMNLLNLIILSSFLILKNNFNNLSVIEGCKNLIEKYKVKNISNFIINNLDKLYVILLAILMFGFLLTPISKSIKKNVQMYRSYKNNVRVLKSLDKEKTYITDMFVKEIYSFPFNNDFYKQNLNMIVFPPFLFSQQTRDVLKKNNIPADKDTLKTIIERDDIYYFTSTKSSYDNFWLQYNMMACYIFMKETYGLEIAFVPIKTYYSGNVKLYDIVILTPEEVKLKESYEKIQENIWLNKLVVKETNKK